MPPDKGLYPREKLLNGVQVRHIKANTPASLLPLNTFALSAQSG